MNILQILFLILIIVTVLIFYLRNKVVNLLAKSLPVVFIILVITALFSLFSTTPFVNLSDWTLKTVKVYDVMKGIDVAIPTSEDLLESANDLFDQIGDFFKPEESEEIEMTEDNENIGILEENLYPVLVNLIAFILKIFTAIFSIAGMIFVTYLNYNTSEIARLSVLEKRIKALEKEKSFEV